MEECEDSVIDLYYPVIIIGAGISGIASACQLQRKFGNQFMVFESQNGIGVEFASLPPYSQIKLTFDLGNMVESSLPRGSH
jgi:predicted NAD/FAD-dependent oxidoreductase